MSEWPEGFMWGTGASSTQTEGASPGSDWYAWEEAGGCPRSGDGNGFATRHAEDFALYAEHGLTHHRLSLDWTRLEPEQGQHDEEEVERYRTLLQAGRDAGLSIWVCLHHFTLPGWFADDLHGFRDDKQGRLRVEPPRRLGGRDLRRPGGRVEADQRADLLRPRRPPARRHPARAHATATRPPTCSTRCTRPAPTPPASCARRPRPTATVEALAPDLQGRGHRRQRPRRPRSSTSDLVGVVGRRRAARRTTTTSASPTTRPSACAATARSARGRSTARRARRATCRWAEGFAHVLDRLSADHPDRPILISEAGIGTDDDQQRNDYVEAVLGIARDAITGGVDLRGHLLVDRRRQLRVGPGLRRALRPLRPRPQPQARRRDRQAAALG